MAKKNPEIRHCLLGFMTFRSLPDSTARDSNTAHSIFLKSLEKGRTEERLNYLETIVGCNKGAETDVFHFVPAKEATHEQPSAATEDN